ncbi:MAG: SH3 domain-containing protein [Deltaproteobacteria bacterium]|nr:SH3 domain-containing protein [Deltaproteobacteria bacterium]
MRKHRLTPRFFSRSVPYFNSAALLFGVLFSISACGSETILNLRTGKPDDLKLEPTLQLKKYAYKKVTITPLEKGVELKNVEIETVREKQTDYYAIELEKVLVRYGLQVLSPEFIAGIKPQARAGKSSLSSAEKALVLGSKTKADAVLLLQKVEVRGLAKYYEIQEGMISEVEPGLVRVDDDGEPYHAESEECLYRVPYYEVRIEAKAVDSATADVLWYGSGRQSSIDVAPQDWVAKIGDDCELLDENYIYGDYLNSEATLEAVVTNLAKRLLTPFAKDAAGGEPIVREAKKAPVTPPPEPVVEPEPPKVKTAVVSAKNVALREGPSKRSGRKAKVPRKTKVEILEVMGEWYKVKVQDGTVGWINEAMIIVNE